jgi:hypothetical protein
VKREITRRRVAKEVDEEREERRFRLESQGWGGRSLIVVVECLRCGGFVGVKGVANARSGDFQCKCGRWGNMLVVRKQVRPSDGVMFSGAR